MARRRRARRNPERNSDVAIWIALGIGATALGVGVYYIATASPAGSSNQLTKSSAPQPAPPISFQPAAVTSFQPGNRYTFTAALPPGMPIDPNAIASALEAFGWTDVVITSITPGTYTATATCTTCPPGMPAGTTAAFA